MALLVKDICSSIYEGIFEAIFVDKTCRVVKPHTFSVDRMPQGDVSLDFHRRPYPKYQLRKSATQVFKSKSKSSKVRIFDLDHSTSSLGPYM